MRPSHVMMKVPTNKLPSEVIVQLLSKTPTNTTPIVVIMVAYGSFSISHTVPYTHPVVMVPSLNLWPFESFRMKSSQQYTASSTRT